MRWFPVVFVTDFFIFFLVSYVGKGHGGLYKASTIEERKKRTAKRRERSDQVY